MRYLAVALLIMICAGLALAGDTVIVTTASDGTPANADIDYVWISGDGTTAAFITAADNLVASDTNGKKDLFRKDLASGVTTRVTVRSDGGQLNSDVTEAAISRDGSCVALVSHGDAFTPSGPPLGAPALYFRELPSGPVEAVLYEHSHIWTGRSIGTLGIGQGGRYIVFGAAWEGLVPGSTLTPQVYLYDRQTSTFSLVSQGTNGEFDPNWPASQPMMTSDGHYVVFQSCCSTLVPNDTNGIDSDIFLRDLQEGTTTRVSLPPNGDEIPSHGGGQESAGISPDGRYVTFVSFYPVLPAATGINAQVYIRDLQTGAVEFASSPDGVTPANHNSWYAAVSGGDRPLVVFASESYDLLPGVADIPTPYIYERDLLHGTVDLVSCTSGGEPLMVDGQYFAASEDVSVILFTAIPTGTPTAALGLAPRQGYKRTRGPFWDVLSRHWAVTYIETCYHAGIVGGYPDGTYRPTVSVDRGQMAVFVSRALAGSDAAVPSGPSIETFSDVATGHWAYRYIEYTVDQGVVGGYSDGTYLPTLTVSRDQMAVFVARGLEGGDAGVPTGPATATFTDVPTDHWAYRHVEHCAAEGVVGGYPDGSYRPLMAVDRAQMAVFIKRGFLG